MFVCRVLTYGQTGDNTWASGKRTICMGEAYTRGKTAGDMKGSTSTIRNMDTEGTSGKTAEYMRGSGPMANSTGKESTDYRMERRDLASGKRGRELVGKMKTRLLFERGLYYEELDC